MGKPKTGIFGLTGCAGDQLVILNCEDQLLDILQLVDIRDFLTAASRGDERCALDLAIVEGAVFSKRDEERLRAIRERSALLVALGTCAAHGGLAALDSEADRTRMLAEVYGEAGRQYDGTLGRALHEVVRVDAAIPGCPIEKGQFIAALAELLNGNPPLFRDTVVCAECRIRENNCLLIEKGIICCGPLTVSGCDARCPAIGVPCLGCRGPLAEANVDSAQALFLEKGFDREEVNRKLRTFVPARALEAAAGSKA
jgi:coenzyme F420-reducing hydrogenase gamma subunit